MSSPGQIPLSEAGSGPRVVIIGAGHAGNGLAAQLREQGHQGPITLIGNEPWLPYHRPPLSKAMLADDADEATLLLRHAEFYESRDIRLLGGRTATQVDRAGRTVTLDDARQLPYDALVFATGARPRPLPLPGATLENVLQLRDLADARLLRDALRHATRLVIVGGGYIGLEVAAAARARGVEVVVIEREARLLARVASAPLSSFFEQFHRAQGVQILHNACLSALVGEQRVQAVVLENGQRIDCDAVLVGIGAIPNDALARQAGLACDNGIVVDACARTSDPAVFAIGDVSCRPLSHYDGRMHRLESVPNALEQARIVSSVILGQPLPAPELPWFWSDQYQLKLQIAGLPFDADRVVVRGGPDQAPMAVYHLRGDRVVAVEAVSSPLDFIAGKKMITEQLPVCAERLADLAHKARDAVLTP